MNANALFVGLALTTFVATASPVFSQQGPPPSERAKQVETLVLRHPSIIKERLLSRISERKTASGFTLTRICLSTI